MKKIILGLSMFFVLGLALLPVLTLATDGTGPYLGLEYGRATGLGTDDVRLSVARIISAALGVLGTVAVVLVIYAGFKWMTSGGNEEEAKGAQKILYAAVIGLVIILSAYALTKFVMTQLFKATTGMEYASIGDNF